MTKAEGERRKAEGIPVTGHRSLITLLLVLAFAGCSSPSRLSDGIQARYFDDNLRYEHPFTEAAAEAARRDAERECTSRKKAAVKSQGTCTLTRCVTNYLCADKPAAADYQR
jgi:hypothetical protein